MQSKMPQLTSSGDGGGDELGADDEMISFKDEGEKEESSNEITSGDLNDIKSSLVNETESSQNGANAEGTNSSRRLPTDKSSGSGKVDNNQNGVYVSGVLPTYPGMPPLTDQSKSSSLPTMVSHGLSLMYNMDPFEFEKASRGRGYGFSTMYPPGSLAHPGAVPKMPDYFNHWNSLQCGPGGQPMFPHTQPSSGFRPPYPDPGLRFNLSRSQDRSGQNMPAGGPSGDVPKTAKEKKNHIKKPLNAFMLFMKEQRAKVVAECTLKESAAINQILGRKWHQLDRSEQSKYYEMARKERQLHMQRYPGWSARDNYAIQIKRKKRRREKQPPDLNEPGNAKKCRARYGIEQQDSWCKPCRRKKKCVRYCEHGSGDVTSDDYSDMDQPASPSRKPPETTTASVLSPSSSISSATTSSPLPGKPKPPLPVKSSTGKVTPLRPTPIAPAPPSPLSPLIPSSPIGSPGSYPPSMLASTFPHLAPMPYPGLFLELTPNSLYKTFATTGIPAIRSIPLKPTLAPYKNFKPVKGSGSRS